MFRFFPYFGAKRQHAAHYAAPRHSLIVEPFAGSAGYATLYHQHRVLLLDVDPSVCETWRYLIRVDPEELLSLPDVPIDGSVDDIICTQEQRALIGWWLQHGRTTPARKPSSWMRSGKRPLSYWGQGVREKLARQVPHIRHWEIREASYDDAPHVEATWFIDPPYKVAGTHYVHGSTGIDYDKLADWCLSRHGQVMVCENDGSDWLPFRSFRSVRATPGRGRSGRSSEAIWTNGLEDHL